MRPCKTFNRRLRKNPKQTEEKKHEVLQARIRPGAGNTDWMRLTGIEHYAQAKKLAVIIPSASNSFYQDMVCGSDYLRFITQEVPPGSARACFPSAPAGSIPSWVACPWAATAL